MNTEVYGYLEEFVSYIVNLEFNNPRLADLSDLHLQHSSVINLATTPVYVRRVNVLRYESGSPSQIGYILTPRNDDPHTYGWILLLFEATCVIQIIRNLWASSSMENLVRHLVRHGIQFRTLEPATKVLPDDIIKLNEASMDFTTIPPMDFNVPHFCGLHALC